jgi:hypothetical protein
MLHIQTFKTGQQSALSQKLLNELSAAKLCLLNPEKREAYDAPLREHLQPKQAVAAAAEPGQAPQAVMPAIAPGGSSAGQMYRSRQKAASNTSRGLIVGGTLVAIVVMAAAGYIALSGPAAPELLPLAAKTIDEGKPLTLDLVLKDPRSAGQTLEYRIVGQPPEGAFLDRAKGRFSWTPNEGQGPGQYDIHFQVARADTPQVTHETVLTVTVHEQPQRPKLDPVDTEPWIQAEKIDLQLHARDADQPPGTLVYALSIDPAPSSPPEFDARTGRFQWMPSESDRNREYRLTFTVWKEGHLDLAARQVAVVSLPARPPTMLADGEAHRRLVADLADAGLALEAVGEVADSPFGGRQRQMKLAGQQLDIVEYASDEAAEADARQLTAEARQINGKPLQFAHLSRVFRRGTLIVLFAGDNAEHLARLERLLGRPFAEGKSMVASSEPMPAPSTPMPMPTSPGSVAAASARRPVPSAEEQEQTLGEIRSIFRERYKSRKADERAELIRELMQKAAGTLSDPVARYALLSEVKNLAQEQPDVATAWQAIDLLAQDYDIVPLELKGEVLEKAGTLARLPLEHRDLADRYLALMEQARQQERYDQAIALSSDALAAARRTKDRALIERVTKVTKETRDARKDFEAAESARKTLAQSPDDAQAKLALGCYLGFVRGQWEAALPLLAQSEAKKVSAAARLELAGPSAADELVAAGDAWWTATDAPKNIDKERLQQRAAHWYRLAMPNVSALERIKLEQKIDKLAPASSPSMAARSPRKSSAPSIPGLPPLLSADDPQLDRLAATVILKFKMGVVSIQLGNEERWLNNESEIPTESFTVKGAGIQHAMAADALLAYLRGLKSLERLTISSGQGITDAGVAVVTELPQLKALTLQLPQLGDATLAHLAKVPRLEQLVVASGQFTDVGLGRLAGHTGLTSIHCQSDLVSDEAFRQLAKLPSLYSLTLQSDRISAAGLPHLRSLGNLRQLNLRSANLNDTHLAELANLPQLQGLTLEGSVGDAGLATVGKLAALQALTIDSTRVTHGGLAHLASASQLTNLSLGSHGPLVNDAALGHLAGLSGLVWLNIAHGEQVTDAGIERLARLEKLQALTLPNAQLTDAALAALATLPQLAHLAIDNARRVTDRGLAHLKDARQLRYLQVTGTQVTDSGAQALRQHLPDCHVAK